MNTKAVIDSNVLVAIVDSLDKWHPKAVSLLNSLGDANIALIYPDCVLNETISVLARRTNEQARAEQFASLLETLSSQVTEDMVTWVSVETRSLYREIVELVSKSQGVLNFHDALIALFCREAPIPVLISFDQDFDGVAWLTRVSTLEDLERIWH